MKVENLKVPTTETIKISAKTNFDKFFWRNILTQIVVNLKGFYKFALIHLTYLFLVRKNTQEETICLSLVRILNKWSYKKKQVKKFIPRTSR